MTDERLEQRLAAALEKTAPDDINGVLSRCQERKGTVIPMKKNQNKRWLRSLAACLAVLLLLGGGVALYGQANAVTSVVSLDVNPSIELRVNSREKVVACAAMNEDAETVLADMSAGADLKGAKLDVAVNAIIGSLVRHGYLEDISSAILISVEDRDRQRADKLQQELTATVDGALQSGAAQASVLSQTVAQDDELERLARENNISTGKAALIQRIVDINDSLSFAELAQLSVEELKDLLEAGAPAMPIGRAAALEAVLRYAGLSETDLRAAEVDPELDENPACYEVELELPRMDELEYAVDAYSGEILYGRANVTIGSTGSSGNTSGDNGSSGSTEIGLDAAKDAALTHAGLTSATFTRAERELDDGQVEYELEFYTDSAEYEYTLSAGGKVLDWEKEPIRQQSSDSGSSGSTEIGLDAAKDAALIHAGLSRTQVRELEAERDVENGRAVYEVDFTCDGVEYEYTIDAASGAVLAHQAERDD